MVDEQHAVQMVHLVLEADGEHAVDLFLVGLAVLVLPAGADPIRAHDLGILLGDRQAAFGVGHLAVRVPQDFGVDEHPRLPDRPLSGSSGSSGSWRSMTSRRIGHADLDRGKADARRGVHRLEHVGDERLQLVVEVSTGLEIWRRTGSGVSKIRRMAMARI